MPTGFVYVVRTVGKDYRQPSFSAVPTWHEDRIYFGPCKRTMRPRMRAGDVVFGLSPSGVFPRRVVFAARIAERVTFAQAYERFPKLRGPEGPIHVRPVRMPGPSFPDSEYEHIPSGMHTEDWRADIRTRDLDAFFICDPCVFRVSRATISRDAGPPISRHAGLRDGTMVTVSQWMGSGQWAGGRHSGSGARRLRMDSPLRVSR